MRAVIFERYGDESVLQVRDRAKPSCGAGELLVRVTSVSLNPVDFKLRQGMLRLIRKPPLPATTGKDFAGVVEFVGSSVRGYSVGDRVFGSVDTLTGAGACAEFITIAESRVARTPDGVSDETASCLGVAAGTALQGLERAGLARGFNVLVTGASGAVGAAVAQIAKHRGAKVTGVCGSNNVEYVRGLGVDRVVDYKREDWTTIEARYEIVFDAAATSSFGAARTRMTETGVYVNTVPGPGVVLASAWGRLVSKQRGIPFMLETTHALLEALGELAKEGVLVPRVARTVGFDGVADAQRAMAEGRIFGKVCVTP
ncbi:MAG: NAD(P)-dependent alcohol dehydrogenase [Myxococcales bacterium]|nr:NAD(P)-dependent alcohol dehydrogenase [Myxococcales bacterium]